MEQKEESSSSCSKDFNPCPICLGSITQEQEAFLDRCFHMFCYKCITRWAKYVASQHSQQQFRLKCPLCKRDNASILYKCEGDSFQQHYIEKDSEENSFFTEAHKFRLRCYYREPGAICDKFNVQKFWKLRRYLQPNKWFQIWLKRELQSLTQVEDVDIVVHHILGLFESFVRRNEQGFSKSSVEKNREEFKALISDAARPFLMGRTERFVTEVELFLISGLNIEAYDDVYKQCLKTANPEDEGRVYSEKTQTPYLHFFDLDSDTE